MAPRPDPVDSDPTLPSHVDVVVIGGGIIGVSTAYFLAERGVSVALIEKHAIACEQSSRNWGWCRQSSRDPREIPLIIESLKLWRGMNERLGEDTGFRQCGILYLCESEADVTEKENWLEHARPYQIGARLISGGEVDRLIPGSTRAFRGALYTDGDGRAEPQKGAPAIARGARRRGAHIVTGCAVRGIETSAGRVSGVVTERGPVACQSVVLAAGAWSRLFCGNLDIPLPQLRVINSVMRTTALDAGPGPSTSGGSFAFRKRVDGGYTVGHRHLSIVDIVPDSFRLFRDFWPAFKQDWRGLRLRVGNAFIEESKLPRRWTLDARTPFEAVRVLDPEPSQWVIDDAFASLCEYFPVFRETRIAETWAGLIDATPDAVPVMAEVEKIRGFFLATGFSGHGFGIGPGAGRLMADLVTGSTPVVDPSPYRYSRFIDGTKLEIIAGF